MIIEVERTIGALRALLEAQPSESPVWENDRWEQAVENAKGVVADYDAGMAPRDFSGLPQQVLNRPGAEL